MSYDENRISDLIDGGLQQEKSLLMSEEEIKQAFENNSDCYSTSYDYNGSALDVPAMSKEKFVEVVKTLLTPAPVSVKTVEDEFLDYAKKLETGSFEGWSQDAINGYKTALKSVTEFYSSLPPVPVKPVGDVMRWVKANKSPLESGEYFIKFTTGQYRGQKSTAYYSRKGNIWMWSIKGGFVEDSHLLEWLDETEAD